MGNEAGRPQSTQDLRGPGEDWGFVLRTVGNHWVVFSLFCFLIGRVTCSNLSFKDTLLARAWTMD